MNKMKELLENAGFEVSKEEEKKQKTKSEEEILREKARKGEILDFEELIKLGFEDENCSFLPRCMDLCQVFRHIFPRIYIFFQASLEQLI